MRNADTTLAIVEDRGKRGLHLEDVYRRLYNEDLYLRAYGRLASNDGAMTKGATAETVDGMSMRKIAEIIELLKVEKFRWTPVRRVQVPKANGKKRPLGIPTWRDQLLQEVMRSILEAYYEPQFSPHSYGFRPTLGCGTALKHIAAAWAGTKWFIEGDIKGCFDNIDHTVLMSILREKIHDNRFLRLVEGLLKAGYLEDWKKYDTLSGTPQGGIISPLLANIYLDRLDKFVEQTLIPEFTKGDFRKKAPGVNSIKCRLQRARKEGDTEAVRIHLAALRKLTLLDQMDPGYRRLKYVRYADDFLLGFIGPKDEAERIKDRIGAFLRDSLKLEMSPEKTLITNAEKGLARFLGYDIRTLYHNIKLRVPAQKIEARVAKYVRNEKPHHRTELVNGSDYSIVAKYGSEFRGFANYYALAQNRHWLNRLKWVMETSMLRTLACKHRATIAQMAKKHKSLSLDRGKWYRCFVAHLERPGKEPLTATFGGFSLSPNPTHDVQDRLTDLDRKYSPGREIVERLLNDTCEICGSDKDIEVHHVRKLADLKVPGRKEPPRWKAIMAARGRKTLVLCSDCHDDIHAGRPTRTRVTTT
jgi:group II intron reverse transcriptase/maturase